MRPNDLYSSPFTLMREFTEELDQLFSFAKNGEAAACYPAMEFVRRNGTVRITARLSYAGNDEIRLFVEHGALIFEGERCLDDARIPFHREIPIPDGLDPNEVTARFADGMLIVEFPFEGVKPRAIPAQMAAAAP